MKAPSKSTDLPKATHIKAKAPLLRGLSVSAVVFTDYKEYVQKLCVLGLR